MSTWTCSACSRLNPVTATRCMACGTAPAVDPTVHRTGPAPVVAPAASMGTTEEPLAPEEPQFPWAIVGAVAVATILVAAVVGVVLARSFEEADSAVKTTAVRSTTTVSPPPTTTTGAPTTTTATTAAPTITTLPPTTTITLPPKPVGVACPSSAPSDGTVFTRDYGGRVLFRPTARKAAREVDSSTDSETIAYWADAGNASFEEETFTTWIKARLPRNSNSCGYVTAANVRMPLDTFGAVLDPSDECDTYEAVTAAVSICTSFDGEPTFTIVWKAQRAASRDVGIALQDGGGWKTEDAGAQLLFTVDNSTIRVTQNGKQLFIDDVLEIG